MIIVNVVLTKCYFILHLDNQKIIIALSVFGSCNLFKIQVITLIHNYLVTKSYWPGCVRRIKYKTFVYNNSWSYILNLNWIFRDNIICSLIIIDKESYNKDISVQTVYQQLKSHSGCFLFDFCLTEWICARELESRVNIRCSVEINCWDVSCLNHLNMIL